MKKISVQILIACSFLLYGPVAMAQVTIKGTVVEESSGQPIAYATVMVGDNETKKPLDGTTTMDDGSFSLETDATDYYIEVSF